MEAAAANCVRLFVPWSFHRLGSEKDAFNPTFGSCFDPRNPKRMGQGLPYYGSYALVKAVGLRSSFSKTFALPLNKDTALGIEKDATGFRAATDYIKETLYEQQEDTDTLIFNFNGATRNLQSGRSDVKKAEEKLEEEEASLKEAEKQSKAAQSAVEESRTVAFWVLNFLASKGQHLSNDYCVIAAKEAYEQLKLAQFTAEEAMARVESHKASKKIAEEEVKAAADALKLTEKDTSTKTKSLMLSLNAEIDLFLREYNLDPTKFPFELESNRN